MLTDAQRAVLTEEELTLYDRWSLLANKVLKALADARITSEARRKVIVRSLSFIKSLRDCYHYETHHPNRDISQLINALDALAKEE